MNSGGSRCFLFPLNQSIESTPNVFAGELPQSRPGVVVLISALGLGLTSCFWVSYNDLTMTSLGIMVSKGNHPQMGLIQVSELL